MTTGLARAEGLTGTEAPTDALILDSGNPMSSDTLLDDNGSRQG